MYVFGGLGHQGVKEFYRKTTATRMKVTITGAYTKRKFDLCYELQNNFCNSKKKPTKLKEILLNVIFTDFLIYFKTFIFKVSLVNSQ